MPRNPATIAKTLLIAFAALALIVFGVFAIRRWSFDEAPNIVVSFVLLPWIVGPAALATLSVARAWSPTEAWLFFSAVVAAIASTAWLWVSLLLRADGQGGLAVLVFPLWQFVALLVYGIVVVAIGHFFRGRSVTT